MRQRFKVFYGESATDLEQELNKWTESLHSSSKIRRTQLAVVAHDDCDLANDLYALVNYEEAE